MKNSMIRWLALAGMVGGVLLVIMEVIEIYDFNLTFTSTPLFLMRLLLQILLALGVWGIHKGQAERGGKFSLIAATILSAAYLVNTAVMIPLVGADIVDWVGYFTTEIINNPLAVVGGLLLLVGLILFGIAILRARTYPRWTGAFLIAHPIIVIVLLPLFGIPMTDGSILDLLLMGLPILWTSYLVWARETGIKGNLIPKPQS